MADREIKNIKNPGKKGDSAAVGDKEWEIINVGAAPNDGTGDPIRDAMIKVNKNFANLFLTENTPNTDLPYTWTNVNTFEANVYINGNTSANVQFITDANNDMDVRFFTKRVYFGGGNSGLEGGELTLGYNGDDPNKPIGNWTVDVFGYRDQTNYFKNAFRIYNYDKNATAHPFLQVNPVEGGTSTDAGNGVFGLFTLANSIPFNVTFARDIGPWEDNIQNFGSTDRKWGALFTYNIYDSANSKGNPGQYLVATSNGIKWIDKETVNPLAPINQSFIGDGTTTVFTIVGGYAPDRINVFLNGVRMGSTVDVDTSSGRDIIFNEAPENGMPIDVVGMIQANTTVDTSKPYFWAANQQFGAAIIDYTGSPGTPGQVLSSTGRYIKWINYTPGPNGNPSYLVKSILSQSFIGDGKTKTYTITGGYTPGELNVFLNGIRMSTSIEVDVSSGTTITFANAPENGMPIDVVGTLYANTTVDTSKVYTWTANQDFISNVSMVGLKANGSLGSTGQVLTTNGSGIYWAAGGGGGGSVNTDAKYTWTNAHTFNVNGALNNNAITITGNAFSINSSGTISQFQIEFSNATNKSVLSSYGLQSNIILTTRISGSKAGTVNTDDLSIEAANVISANAILAPRKGIAANGSMGALGQILASNGNGIYWVDSSAASVNTASQYTWTNTHNFNANATNFNGSKVIIGGEGITVPNITLGNMIGWYVDASNTFSAIGTAKSQFIIENPAASPGKIGIGSSQVPTDLNLTKGVIANGSFGSNGQFLTTNGSSVYWVSGGGASVNTSAEYIWTNNHTFNDKLIVNNTDGSGGELAVNGTSFSLISQYVNGSAVGGWYSYPTSTGLGTTKGNINFVLSDGAAVVNSAGINFGFPKAQGLAGYVLTNDGAGNTYWGTGGGGNGSVNTAAAYTWTNAHTFNVNGALNNNAITITGNAYSINSFGTINQFQIAFSNATNKSVLSSYGLQANIILTTRISGSKDGTVNTDDLSIEAANNVTVVAKTTNFANAGVVIGFAAVPNITLGNMAGWYVDASNTFSAIGTGKSTLIMENPASSPGKIGIGSAQAPADLTLTKGVIANGSFGSNGQFLTTNGSSVYWVSGGGGSVNTAAKYTWTNTHTFNNTDTVNGLQVNGASYSMVSQYVGGAAVGSWYSYPTYTTLATTNGSIHITTSGTITANNTTSKFVFPKTNGAAGQVLSTDGTGVTSWIAAGGGGSVNTDAKYTWTNAHTFNVNGALNNNAIIITGNAYSINSSGVINQFQIEFSNATNKSVLSSFGLQANVIFTTDIRGSKDGSGSDDLKILAANNVTINAKTTNFANAGVVIGFASIPNITLGNMVGWYVDASNTFSAIGTGKSTLIMENPATGTGKIGIGSAQTLTDLNLSKGIIANGSLGTAGQRLTSDGSKVYWAAGGGSGTVTSVSGTGTVSGITLSGSVTTSGSLTLGGTLSVQPTNLSAGAPSWTSAGAVTTAGNITVGSGGAGIVFAQSKSYGVATLGLDTGGVWQLYSTSAAGGAKSIMTQNLSNGNMTITGTYSPASDIKLKENILDINKTEAIEKVRLLQGVTYNKIGNNENEREMGFIANHVEPIIPELVSESNIAKEGETPNIIKTLNYDGMTAVLCEAVKHLDDENKTLKEELAALRQEVKALLKKQSK